jgi:AAA domain
MRTRLRRSICAWFQLLTFERLFAFLVVGHGRRQLLWFAVTRNPSAEAGSTDGRGIPVERPAHALIRGPGCGAWRPNARGIIEPTPLFKQLREAALDIRPRSITIDTVADVFAGNENDRSQVRQFVGMLRGLAIEANSALAILAHPSLSGISSGLAFLARRAGTIVFAPAPI